MALVVTLRAALLGLQAQSGHNLGPILVPTVTASDVTQSQYGVDMRARPVHATALQASFDHQFVAALHGAVPDRPASGLEGGVLHVLHPFFQIGQVAGQIGLVRMQGDEFPHICQHLGGAVVFEVVQPFGQPRFCRRRFCTP